MTADEHIHREDVDHSGETFQRADFAGHVFEGSADFADCVFQDYADFSGAVFKGRVFFIGAVFEQGADFYEARFERFANFYRAEIAQEAIFTGAVFENGWLSGITVAGRLNLERAHLDKTSQLGPLQADAVDLELAEFTRRVRLDIRAREIICRRTMFFGGAQFLADGADITLVDAELGPASRIATHAGFTDAGEPARRPRLVTVSGTDVSNLSISRADLSACKFVQAHNLDGLTVDYDGAFGWTPSTLRVAKRQVIGDEYRWRATQGPTRARGRWAVPDSWPDLDPPRDPAQVASSYRALRKSREDAKDEPGAADFYYGEMEMRRLGKWLEARAHRRASRWRNWFTSRAEHALLWLYWLVSGYGLRAWRAFVALAVVVAIAAAGFFAWGFPPGAGMDYADSVRFTLRSTTSLLRGTEQRLTPTGEWIELTLRLLGPVLFGLALLALRGRVKR